MRILPLIVGLLLLLWMFSGANWMSKNRPECLGFAENVAVNTPEATIAPIVATPPTPSDAFVIQDNDFIASAPEGILFTTSDDSPLIANPTETALQQLATYLKENSDRKVILQGRYGTEEDNATSYLNLGLARAGSIKDRLINMGADPTRIELSGVKLDDLSMRNDTILNSLDFQFGSFTTLNADSEIVNLKSEVIANPAIIYFATNSANVDLNNDFTTRIQNMKTYLRSVEGTTITVMGHTDNVGNRTSNINLSQRRAAQVKQYLVRQGIEESRINVVGRGPDTPMVDNATPEGRAKNRRVEITLDN